MRASIPRKNTNRVEKVNSLIQHLLGNILLRFFKDRDALVTISKVETSKDLRWAKVWITVVNGDSQKVLAVLEHNLYDIQGELNREMQVKIVPRLSFHLDASGEYAQHINEIFHKIAEEREHTDTEQDGENQDGRE